MDLRGGGFVSQNGGWKPPPRGSVFRPAAIVTHFDNPRVKSGDNGYQVRLLPHDLTDIFVNAGDFVRTCRQYMDFLLGQIIADRFPVEHVACFFSGHATSGAA